MHIRPTTQPLYQGARKPEKKARRIVHQVELQILLVECKVPGSIPERTVFAFHIFKLAKMIVQCNGPILIPVVYKWCKLWQTLHDEALKFAEEFSLRFDFGTLPFRNIAHGKKKSYI